jgi:electron transfer flavoprotein beta subunit
MIQKRIFRIRVQHFYYFFNSTHNNGIKKRRRQAIFATQTQQGRINTTNQLDMKILVCISKTPDTTAKIAFADNNTKFSGDGVQWIINPYDEWYALVRAIELKEANPAVSIHLITVGGADCEPIIRKALALGGDEAFRINSEENDSYAVAMEIANFAKAGAYDLIFTGKETIDYNSASIGGMISAALDLPFISHATKFQIDGNKALINREIEGGEETLTSTLPLVVSCQKGMAEQRIPNMKGIMGARSKSLKTIESQGTETLTSIASFSLPAAKAGVKLVSPEQPEELIRLLQEEAKVI